MAYNKPLLYKVCERFGYNSIASISVASGAIKSPPRVSLHSHTIAYLGLHIAFKYWAFCIICSRFCITSLIPVYQLQKLGRVVEKDCGLGAIAQLVASS
jgi:hypothetical protein